MSRFLARRWLVRLCFSLGLGVLAASHPARAASEKVAYEFKPAAANPGSGLTALGNKLYGTTSGGRAPATIFEVTPTGKVRTVATFPDNPFDLSGLLAVGRLLYGVTSQGGDPTCQCGYVFSATEKGDVTILHSFTGGDDGAYPSGNLMELNGVLYGTAAAGGVGQCTYYALPGCGTVFGITPKGGYTQIYAFQGPTAGDGLSPSGPLTAANGILYGTTGGGGSSPNQYQSGTLFSLSLQGVETVLHSFGLSKKDGYGPEPGLLLVGDTLYGTTNSGGPEIFGIAYSIGLDGSNEKILHAFQENGTDGQYPEGGLIAVDGLLYGTTRIGGSANLGTVFSLTQKGDETIVYTFQGINKQLGIRDAAEPNAPLLYVDGSLYGTSSAGGLSSKYCAGGDTRVGSCGTIFEVTP